MKKKRAPAKTKPPTTKTEKPKAKYTKTKSTKKTILIKSSSSSTSSSDYSDKNDSGTEAKPKPKIKRKTTEKAEFKEIVVQKRMASLNASAMLAATYEVERHFDRCDSMYNDHLSDSPVEMPQSPVKIEKIKAEIEEPKEVRKIKTYFVT